MMIRKGGRKMKEKVLLYCKGGENCAVAILKAAAEKYNFPLSSEMEKGCSALNAGFGIGGFCCALVACIMIFGILFSEEEAKKKRLIFLMEFQERFGSLNCGILSAKRTDCVELMGEIGQILEDTIGK